MVPPVGLSRSAITRRKVVLPQPDGPMKETNSPLWMSRLTSDSACTGPSLVWKVRSRFWAEMTGGVVTRVLSFISKDAPEFCTIRATISMRHPP
jgi:hypothetical protein